MFSWIYMDLYGFMDLWRFNTKLVKDIPPAIVTNSVLSWSKCLGITWTMRIPLCSQWHNIWAGAHGTRLENHGKLSYIIMDSQILETGRLTWIWLWLIRFTIPTYSCLANWKFSSHSCIKAWNRWCQIGQVLLPFNLLARLLPPNPTEEEHWGKLKAFRAWNTLTPL